MLAKLTTLVISGILTVGLVAAAAPTVDTKQSVTQRAEVMVNACRQGYIEYRYGKVDAKEALNKTLFKFPVEQRGVVALICLGYGEGFEDGKRGTV